MANGVVGTIYQKILDTTIDESRTDFEESGVSVQTLMLMREKWQARLSQSERADFPWDERPQTVPKSERTDDTTPNLSQTNGYSSSPSIKQEQGFDYNNLNIPRPARPATGMDSAYASQRAMEQMRQQFGIQATNSINATQAAQMNQRYPGASQPPPRQSYPQYPQQSPYAPPGQGQQIKTESSSQPYIKRENEDQPNGLGSAQHDGASDEPDDWQAVVAMRGSNGKHNPIARVDADRQIRRMIEVNAQRLEGGGLMVPLNERRPTPQGAASASSSLPQFGGDAPREEDEDDDDKDAINSDLDDPADVTETELEGEYEGDIILCLYDKVQRVKNKWKCTLREGILTLGGKDYVFHKASGEFEW